MKLYIDIQRRWSEVLFRSVNAIYLTIVTFILVIISSLNWSWDMNHWDLTVILVRCWSCQFVEAFRFYLLKVVWGCQSSCSAVIGGESVGAWVAFNNMIKTVFTFAQLKLFLWGVSKVCSICCCLWLHAEHIHSWLMNIGICRPWLLTCCWSRLKWPWREILSPLGCTTWNSAPACLSWRHLDPVAPSSSVIAGSK